jgi:hypothetical protein
MARALSGTLLFSLRIKGGEAPCAITLDDSSDRQPRPLIGNFFNSIGHKRSSCRIPMESVIHSKADIQATE